MRDEREGRTSEKRRGAEERVWSEWKLMGRARNRWCGSQCRGYVQSRLSSPFDPRRRRTM